MKANVIVELGFARTSLRFGAARVGHVSKQRVDVLVNTAEPVKFGEVTSTLEGMSAELREAPPAAKGGEKKRVLEVSYDPKKLGRINGTVSVATDHPKHPTLTLRVYGEVRGDISAHPSRVTINLSRAVATPLQVSSVKGPFKVTGAKDKDGYLKITKKQKTSEGRAWELDLLLTDKAKAKTRSFSSSVVITTDDKAQPSLEVPIYFHAPRKPVAQPGKR